MACPCSRAHYSVGQGGVLPGLGGGFGLASPTGSQRSVRAAQAEAIVSALRAAGFEAYTFTRDD